MKKTACVWCSKPVSVLDSYNDLLHKAVCSPACKAGEAVFMVWMSDEEINKRTHYNKLTEGK